MKWNGSLDNFLERMLWKRFGPSNGGTQPLIPALSSQDRYNSESDVILQSELQNSQDYAEKPCQKSKQTTKKNNKKNRRFGVMLNLSWSREHCEGIEYTSRVLDGVLYWRQPILVTYRCKDAEISSIRKGKSSGDGVSIARSRAGGWGSA